MTFWDQVDVDMSHIFAESGDGAQIVTPGDILAPDGREQLGVPMSPARQQSGIAAINARNIGMFDRERDMLTQGRVVVTCFRSVLLDFGGLLPNVGWGLRLDEVEWDYARTESYSGGVLTIVWTRREVVDQGAEAGRKLRQL